MTLPVHAMCNNRKGMAVAPKDGDNASSFEESVIASKRTFHYRGLSSFAILCSLVVVAVTRDVSGVWNAQSVDAFVILHPSAKPSSTKGITSIAETKKATTCLFLFSLNKENSEKSTSTGNITDRDTARDHLEDDVDETGDDFVAWMDGIKFGTPLGKLAAVNSAGVASSSGANFTSLPTVQARSSTTEISEESLSTLVPRAKDPSEYISSVSLSESAARQQRVNPLSNLIQFEAIMELAKIAGSNNINNDTDQANSSNATDVFAVVDKLVRTFQKQEEANQNQREQKELLQLAQLEEPTIEIQSSPESEARSSISVESESTGVDISESDLNSATTVKDLIELERYVERFSFRKVTNIWDTFSTKETTDEDNEALEKVTSDDDSTGGNGTEDDLTSIASAGSASSSLLFRTTQGPAPRPVTPSLQDLVGRATINTGATVESISNEIVAAAQKIAKESGVELNVQFAADRAREATEYAVGVANTANIILDAGYAYGSRSGAAGMSRKDDDLTYLAASGASKSVLAENKALHQAPLFGAFSTAQRIEPYEYPNALYQGSLMGALAGAIYENTLERCHSFGHSLVANGTSANVAWMVTDSLMKEEDFHSAFRHHEDENVEYNSPTDDKNSMIAEKDPALEDPTKSEPVLIRTITIRGFDASDESVDREALLNDICFATPETLDEETADKVVIHKGLLTIAKQVYQDTRQYIDWASPNTKIILNGHSVGGSLSILMLLLITSERGVDFVQDRIARVYSHGSPPVATVIANVTNSGTDKNKFFGTQRCRVLEAFGLPSSTVYSYIQPYDPVVRLFSDHDVLYPLVDDLGKDGITLYSSGPIRSLRPITRALFQAWDGWPQFRDNWKETCDTQYHSVGIQHILLPEPLRYLNDRFISVNAGVPPVDTMIRVSPEELLPALDGTFPLDTFQVSLIPQAVRSFLHHFYPAYDAAILDYADKMKRETEKINPVPENETRAFQPFLTTQSLF